METHYFPLSPPPILTPMIPLWSTRILGLCLAAPSLTLHIQLATGSVESMSLSQIHPLLDISLPLFQLRSLS